MSWEGHFRLENRVSTAIEIRSGTSQGGWAVGYDRGRSRK